MDDSLNAHLNTDSDKPFSVVGLILEEGLYYNATVSVHHMYGHRPVSGRLTHAFLPFPFNCMSASFASAFLQHLLTLRRFLRVQLKFIWKEILLWCNTGRNSEWYGVLVPRILNVSILPSDSI